MPRVFDFASLGGRSRQAAAVPPTGEMNNELDSDRQGDTRPPVYGRPSQGVSSAEAVFPAPQGYNIAYMSLHALVFKISETSATPIANIMCQGLTDGEILELVDDNNVKTPVTTVGPTTPGGSKPPTLMITGAKIRKSRGAAKIVLGERLRDKGYVDVEIVYESDKYMVTIQPFSDDKNQLSKLGGWPYHWCFRKEEKEMALAIICKQTALDEVFPPKRLADGKIVIRVNTKVAEPEAKVTAPEPKPAGSGTMFPYEKANRVIDDISNRPRSDSLQKVSEVPQDPNASWNEYSHASRAEDPEPIWTSDNDPWSGLPGAGQEWCRDDLKKKRELLDSTSGSDPVPLSNVYTADRNFRWHEENIAKQLQNDSLTEYQRAEATYLQEAAKARDFYTRYYALVCFQALANPNDPNNQAQARAANQEQQQIALKVKNAQARWVQKGKECGRVPDPAKLNAIQQLDEQAWMQIETALKARRQAALEEQSSAPNDTPPRRVDTPFVHQGFTTDSTAASQASSYETQVSQVDEAHRPSTPFPAYVDPLVNRTQDMAATQQNISTPFTRPRAQRTNIPRTLRDLMTKKGCPDPRVASGSPAKVTLDTAKAVAPQLSGSFRSLLDIGNSMMKTDDDDDEQVTSGRGLRAMNLGGKKTSFR